MLTFEEYCDKEGLDPSLSDSKVLYDEYIVKNRNTHQDVKDAQRRGENLNPLF